MLLSKIQWQNLRHAPGQGTVVEVAFSCSMRSLALEPAIDDQAWHMYVEIRRHTSCRVFESGTNITTFVAFTYVVSATSLMHRADRSSILTTSLIHRPHRSFLHSHNVTHTPHRSFLHSHNVTHTPHRSFLHSHNVTHTPHRSFLHAHNVTDTPHRSFLHSHNATDTPHRSFLHSHNATDTPHISFLHSHNITHTPHRSFLHSRNVISQRSLAEMFAAHPSIPDRTYTSCYPSSSSTYVSLTGLAVRQSCSPRQYVATSREPFFRAYVIFLQVAAGCLHDSCNCYTSYRRLAQERLG